MSDIWVRPFKRADAAACAQVFYDAVHVGAADHYTAGQRTAWCPALAAADAFGDSLKAQTCFVAETTQVCGFMSLENDVIDMAYVAPDMQGSGVADLLYAMTLNAAMVQGIT
ncbi:MAG: GNAT family N-acetyltransferase, partial [Planktomarina sp.]